MDRCGRGKSKSTVEHSRVEVSYAHGIIVLNGVLKTNATCIPVGRVPGFQAIRQPEAAHESKANLPARQIARHPDHGRVPLR